MEVMIGLILGILIAAVISGAVIWLVGKMNLGLSVDSFGWAMLAGLFIGVISNLILHFTPQRDGVIGATINLIVSAAVILLAGKTLSGVKVEGYSGALLAAFAMALISFGLGMIAGGAGSAPV